MVTHPRHGSTGLTNAPGFVTLGNMAVKLQRLDPERRRKRLALLAELAGAKAVRDHVTFGNRKLPHGDDRLRQLIAYRRRLAG